MFSKSELEDIRNKGEELGDRIRRMSTQEYLNDIGKHIVDQYEFWASDIAMIAIKYTPLHKEDALLMVGTAAHTYLYFADSAKSLLKAAYEALKDQPDFPGIVELIEFLEKSLKRQTP